MSEASPWKQHTHEVDFDQVENQIKSTGVASILQTGDIRARKVSLKTIRAILINVTPSSTIESEGLKEDQGMAFYYGLIFGLGSLITDNSQIGQVRKQLRKFIGEHNINLEDHIAWQQDNYIDHNLEHLQHGNAEFILERASSGLSPDQRREDFFDRHIATCLEEGRRRSEGLTSSGVDLHLMAKMGFGLAFHMLDRAAEAEAFKQYEADRQAMARVVENPDDFFRELGDFLASNAVDKPD